LRFPQPQRVAGHAHGSEFSPHRRAGVVASAPLPGESTKPPRSLGGKMHPSPASERPNQEPENRSRGPAEVYLFSEGQLDVTGEVGFASSQVLVV
jgi:hypothetical protein